ncbi:unnamed protein product [Symbiodinium sp. KB8]|nr:unnamed protein product [Symbiodinium sp. KB8]
MPQFLERENEDLPESWRGIWWLEDNTANETLVSMQDMWKTEALAGKELFFKDQATNWTAGTSLWGTLLRKMSKVKVPFELEPGENPKWLGMLTGASVYGLVPGFQMQKEQGETYLELVLLSHK